MKLNRGNLDIKKRLPIKVVQFGEGNFLRAFVDYAFQQLNVKNGLDIGVSVVQPIKNGMVDLLEEQDGLYTLFMRGVKKGVEIQEKELIQNIVSYINPYENYADFLELAKEEELEFIVSNTTEAGIAFDEDDDPAMQPPNSFPAKLCMLLYKRYKHFRGEASKGLTIIPCELINYNGDTLKQILVKYIDKWGLEEEFEKWVLNHNEFYNTLVDRIVPGYPKAEIAEYEKQLKYEDNLIVSAETFFLWVIEGGDSLKKKLPFEKTGLDVKIVDNMQPYRTRKVRILNGAHTVMVPFSLMYGNETVKQTVDNEFTGDFVQKVVFDEIIPTLDMKKKELKEFATEILDRFRNPFIKHNLSSIALNSISKFKVRVLPSLLGYFQSKNELPKNLTFAFACLIRFYKGEWNGNQLPVNDDEAIMEYMKEQWSKNELSETVSNILAKKEFWDKDLNSITGLKESIVKAIGLIEEKGIEEGLKNFAI